MCHAIPAQIVSLRGDHNALANVGGIEREISVVLLNDLKVGDYVVVHVGFALTKLDESEAQKTLETIDNLYKEEI